VESNARALSGDETVTTTGQTTRTTTQRLVALDIDGTLIGEDRRIPPGTVAALDLVRAAGHHVVLATGRSLIGLGPIATRLGLVEGYAVCSNGALTIRLDPTTPTGYVVDTARQFEPCPAIRQALEMAPDVRIAVEEISWGWRVNTTFDPGLLNGPQKQVPLTELTATPVSRVALHSPGIGRHSDAVSAAGVTATPAGPDWLDLTAPGTSKAAALEAIRTRLDVPAEQTVAVGDGINDLEMLAWAAHSVAMGHAPAVVQAAADEVTGTITQSGAVAVLHSLLPPTVDVGSLSPLAAQLATAVVTAHGTASLVRVWHGTGSGLSRCEIWTRRNGAWVRHAPVPAGTGVTMRAIERAAREAELTYPRGNEGRRRAHWRASVLHDDPAGFDLPLALT
jgi:trehalose-6-phosphatase